ncbi:hypothetical protein FRC07_005593 [Ceratobasidium sp. 392]|nr:hypothetical protein FRC07_005593 [Ceratobasidium sp. 392]
MKPYGKRFGANDAVRFEPYEGEWGLEAPVSLIEKNAGVESNTKSPCLRDLSSRTVISTTPL